MGERFEFSWVGQEEDDDDAFDLSSIAAATVFVVHQGLYEALDDEYTPGERVGDLDGTVAMGRRGRAVCHFIITLDRGASLVASGVLPAERAWSERWISITGGTGEFELATGSIRTKSKNPKRYDVSFVLGG